MQFGFHKFEFQKDCYFAPLELSFHQVTKKKIGLILLNFLIGGVWEIMQLELIS